MPKEEGRAGREGRREEEKEAGTKMIRGMRNREWWLEERSVRVCK